MSGIVKPLFNTPLNRSHWASQNLVASYLFNEGAGPTVHDSSGNENHGTMIGFGAEDTPTSGWVPGPHGGALAFDGYRYILVSSLLNLQNVVSLCTIFTPSSISGAHIIAGKGYSSSQYQSYLIFQYNSDIIFRITTGGAKEYTDVLAFSETVVGTTYNIIGTYDGSIMQTFVSGIQTNSANKTGIMNNVQPFQIGAQSGAAQSGADSFIGQIHSVSVYEYALSPEEISYLVFDPYTAYRWDDSIFSKPFNQNYYRHLLAGGY